MTKEFIEEILSEKIAESDTLEFKDYHFENGKLKSLKQELLSDLFKEICAFANYKGGKIIIGIGEDDNHNPCDIHDIGVNKDTFEQWETGFRNKIAVNTIPSLYGVKTELVPMNENTNCILIHVPKSDLNPHAFNNGSVDKFYIRNGNTSIPMRYNDLKNSFDALNHKQQKLIGFRNERISNILNDEVDDSLLTEPSLLIHIFPESAFESSNYVNLKSFEYNEKLDIFNPYSSARSKSYNADGLIITSKNYENHLSSYVQVFSNGCLEVGEISLMNCHLQEKNDTIYYWDELEKLMAKKIYEYCMELDRQNLGNSFYVSFSLLNVKNFRSRTKGYGEFSEPIRKNIIKSPFIKWTTTTHYPESMYQLFNKFANIFGSRESSLYNNGEFIENKFDFLVEDELSKDL